MNDQKKEGFALIVSLFFLETKNLSNANLGCNTRLHSTGSLNNPSALTTGNKILILYVSLTTRKKIEKSDDLEWQRHGLRSLTLAIQNFSTCRLGSTSAPLILNTYELSSFLEARKYYTGLLIFKAIEENCGTHTSI